MEVAVEIIPQIVLRVFAPLLCVCLVAWAALCLCRFLSSSFCTLGKRVPPAQWVTIAVVMVVCTLFSGKNTNSVQSVGVGAMGIPPVAMLMHGSLVSMGGMPVAPAVTPEDMSNGWRIAEVSDSGAFAPPPANVVTNERWRLRGAHDDAFRIPTNGWSYPFVSGVTVLSCGEIRKSIRSRDFPRAFEQDLSLLPVASWQLLPDGRNESVFWHGATPSNTLIATWWNAALGRDATNPVCFQAELHTNGGFDYRYEDRTVRHVRVWPFDLDDDGLENTVDPDPLIAGSDAHGTNAEWYNTVCSNVFEAVEEGDGASGTPRPTLSWREGVNSNAYYFVDVVTTNGPAPIYFMGDRESRLGNPVVVARAFETNHVPLLIGINYAVTSPVPFSASLPYEGFATISTNGVSNYEVRWPLDFVFTESIEGANRIYTVTVEPYDPGGVLTWEGGGMRSGTSSGCGCGCLGCVGYYVCFSCSLNCTCDGECQAVGGYTFEDALFAVIGGVCRCGFDDPVETGTGTGTNNVSPVSVSFSKQAVIFEDAYENMPGVTTPKRSSRVRITVEAYGGAFGGSLSVSSENLDKLAPVGCGVALPIIDHVLAAGEYFHITGVYEGAEASGSGNDVTLSGTFTEYFTSQQYPSGDSLTVVKVKFTPNVTAPSNDAFGRHEYGVCELVEHDQYPSTPTVTWNPVGGGSNTINDSGAPCYQFPLFACENPLRVELGDATYLPRLSCIEPTGIEVREVDLCTYGLSAGKAGGIGLLQAFYVKPFTVSFSQIAIEEVPSDRGEVEGYFYHALPSNLWSHTSSAGAGRWHDVTVHNRMGNEYFRDEAAYATEMLPITPDGILTNDYTFGWMWGVMTWDMPFGWNAKGTTDGTAPSGMFEGTTQEFYIDPWGNASVRKFNNQATRRLDDSRYLNGVRIFNNEVRNP